jgi:hypothetical protein
MRDSARFGSAASTNRRFGPEVGTYGKTAAREIGRKLPEAATEAEGRAETREAMPDREPDCHRAPPTMSSDWFFLSDDQFNEFLRLNRAYYHEAKFASRCPPVRHPRKSILSSDRGAYPPIWA